LHFSYIYILLHKYPKNNNVVKTTQLRKKRKPEKPKQRAKKSNDINFFASVPSVKNSKKFNSKNSLTVKRSKYFAFQSRWKSSISKYHFDSLKKVGF